MIPALLHGKLSREQENMEDILTSSVFGILRYLPAEKGLLPFLRKTQTIDGRPCPIDVGEGARADYLFWPTLKERGLLGETEFECHSCEPDVLLKIHRADGSRLYILIEAKLYSGKSSGPSEDPVTLHDQLAREWENLVFLSRRDNAESLLIFLTADFSIPADQIRESEEEYLRKRPGGRFVCGWLTWRQIPIVFASHADNDHLPQRDLVELCKRLNLRFFDGIVAIEALPDLAWRFQPAAMTIEWLPGQLRTFDWRYGG